MLRDRQIVLPSIARAADSVMLRSLLCCTSVPGQKAKFSLRANVFRFAPESGHRALQSACLFRANNGSGCFIRLPCRREREALAKQSDQAPVRS
jgi:hypothetical protein